MDLYNICNKCGYCFKTEHILNHIKTCNDYILKEQKVIQLKDIYDFDYDDDNNDDNKLTKNDFYIVYRHLKIVDICYKCSKSYSYKSIYRHLRSCKLREPSKLNINLKNDDYERRLWKKNINEILSNHFYQFKISDDEYNNEYVLINDMSCFIDGIDD